MTADKAPKAKAGTGAGAGGGGKAAPGAAKGATPERLRAAADRQAVAAARRAKAKTAPDGKAASEGAEGGAPPADRAPRLRKKDLIARVVKAAGSKRKDTRDIVEAVLTVLGDALAAGETLALPPFGKARVNRQRDVEGGEMLTVKLRRSSGTKPKDPLAEPAE
jgi:nucleoid DNA-binding protein